MNLRCFVISDRLDSGLALKGNLIKLGYTVLDVLSMQEDPQWLLGTFAPDFLVFEVRFERSWQRLKDLAKVPGLKKQPALIIPWERFTKIKHKHLPWTLLPLETDPNLLARFPEHLAEHLELLFS
jgi:hypothetical protein